MIINRYLSKELIKTLLVVTSVLLLIAISNKLVKLISKTVSGELSLAIVSKVLILQIPELLSLLLPLSLFIAILLSFGRMFVDQEFTVLFACGVSWQAILNLGLKIGGVVMLIVSGFTLWLNPTLNHIKQNLIATETPTILLETLAQGRFYSIQNDRLVFYVEALSQDKTQLQEVFIAEHPQATPNSRDWTVLTADSGKIITDPEKGLTYLVLHKGSRYQGRPGMQDYDIVDFETYGRLIEKQPPKAERYYHRSMPTPLLWKTAHKSFMAELQWRLSVPLATPILVLLAIPLSQVSPRGSRFAKLIPAMLLFIVYFNLLTVSKRLIANGTLTPYIGLWWVHGLMLSIGLGLFAKVTNRLRWPRLSAL
jgi:lipopolysaccharide export system permease protein